LHDGYIYGTIVILVEEYLREDGSSPYREWFAGLDAQAAAKIAIATLRLATGNTANVKWFGAFGEYRLDWGPGYRIYLARDRDAVIILFGGGTKNRQQKDIERARALWIEFKARNKAQIRNERRR
jgi:putative addiction module killer protein